MESKSSVAASAVFGIVTVRTPLLKVAWAAFASMPSGKGKAPAPAKGKCVKDGGFAGAISRYLAGHGPGGD